MTDTPQTLESFFGEDFAPTERGKVTFLADPEPRHRKYALISVDDHFVEPKDIFTSRAAAADIDRVPQVVEREDGAECWQLGDEQIEMPISGTATVGRPVEEWTMAPMRFDEMRRGAWDPVARAQDMDIAGVAMSLNFPSAAFGFSGRRLMNLKDERLILDCVRAYNDWVIDEWCAAAPGRFIPCQITYLLDPEIAAEEVRRNAPRGCPALAFSENPQKLGLPSLHTGYWEPLIRACAETGTVVNLHVGSSSALPFPSTDSPIPDSFTTLFQASSFLTASDWLWSQVPVRYPDLRIVFAEGGIGWVQMFYDQLEMRLNPSIKGGTYQALTIWKGFDVTPLEALRRNFRFASLWDKVALRSIDVIGPETVMTEMDYPHADSTWPDPQRVVELQLEGHTDDFVERYTWRNAAELYRLDFDAEAFKGAGPPPV